MNGRRAAISSWSTPPRASACIQSMSSLVLGFFRRPGTSRSQ